MPRPCINRHPTLQLEPGACKFCFRCADRSAKSAQLRRIWGEPEPSTDVPVPAPWPVPSRTIIPADKAGGQPKLQRSVIVPPPPPLAVFPQSQRAVVTVAAGAQGRELLTLSGPLMEAYARRVGADFLVLEWPGHPEWSMSCKFMIPRALEHYDRILYVDVDVLLTLGCPDLFAICPEGYFGAADDAAWPNLHSKGGVMDEYRAFLIQHGIAVGPEPLRYLNTGVFLAERQHAPLLEAPTYPLLVHHLSEQNHFNAMLHRAGVPIHLLPRTCNWQHWTDRGFRTAPAEAILHCAGMDHPTRLGLMRKLAEGYQRTPTSNPPERPQALLEHGKPAETPPKPVRSPAGRLDAKIPGPGTLLKEVLGELGIDDKEGCGCASFAAQMDTWGLKGCEAHRPAIINQLNAARAKMGWTAKLAAAVRAASSGLAWRINPLQPAESLLDEALRRARCLAQGLPIETTEPPAPP